MEKTNTENTEHDAKMSALGNNDDKQETNDIIKTLEKATIKETIDPIDPVTGWIDIKREDIPYDGRLYPSKLRFQVKPVSSETIKHFSSMDESNPLSVNDALTYVVQNHIRVLDGNRKLNTLDVVYEVDRFFFVMLVHAYTGATTALKFPTLCKADGDCSHKQDAVITAYNLQVKPLKDKAWSYLNEELGKFIVDTKSMGRWTFKPLSLKLSGQLTEYIMAQRKEGNKVDKMFLRVAPFLNLSEQPNDEMLMKNAFNRYKRLTDDAKKITLVDHLEEILSPEQLPEIKIECSKCKRPFRTPISSVAGLRSIFFVHDIDGELS